MAKKKAYRRLVKIQGKTTVQYIDAETGEPITNLDGYELVSGGGFGNELDNPKPKEEEKPESVRVDDREEGRGDVDTSGSNKSFWEEWADNPKTSKGSDDIFGDLNKAFGNLKQNITNAAIGAFLGTDAGRNVLQQGVKSVTDTVGGKVDELKKGAEGAIAGIGNAIGNVLGTNAPKNGAYQEARIASNVKGTNPEILGYINEAAKRSPYIVEVVSGNRPGDTRQHGKDNAIDVRLINPDTGEVLDNYQNASTFRQYEEFAQTVKAVQLSQNPASSDLRWGGYFSGPAGKYGAVDLMHFDLAGNKIGMAGGTWEKGLTTTQKDLLPGANSKGMGDLNQYKGKELPPPGTPMFGDKIAPVEDTQKLGGKPTGTNPVASTLNSIGGALGGLFGAVGITPTPHPSSAVTAATPQSYAGMERATVPTQVASMVPSGGFAGQDTALGTVAPPQNIPQSFAGQDRAVPNQVTPVTDNLEQARPMTVPGGSFAGQERGAPTPLNNALQAPTPQVASAPDYTAVQNAYLDTLNKAEGAPKANTLFGGNVFDDLGTHPNTKVPYGNGISTAAGLYQINYPTWNEYAPKVGVTDFSPESQKKVALNIAETNYSKKTGGRDIWKDLATGNVSSITGAFVNNANRWASLPSGRQTRTTIDGILADYRNALNSYVAPIPATRQATQQNDITSTKLDQGKGVYSSFNSDKWGDKTANRPASNYTAAKESNSDSSSGFSSPKTSNTSTSSQKSSDKAGNAGRSSSDSSNYSSNSDYGYYSKTDNTSTSGSKSSDKAGNVGRSSSGGGFSSPSSGSSGKTSNSSSSSSKSSDKSSSKSSSSGNGFTYAGND